MGEFSYSLSSGPSDPRADIFQSTFPAQQDMREGWESASSILTFSRKMLNRCADVDSPPTPSTSQQEAITTVILQESPMEAQERFYRHKMLTFPKSKAQSHLHL